MDIRSARAMALDRLEGILEQRELDRVLSMVFEDEFNWITSKPNRLLSEPEKMRFHQILQALSEHQPIQYILGTADFYGYVFKVSDAVLIPRPETEELVFWMLETIREVGHGAGKILDIGTGSGCIPIVLSKKLSDSWELWGQDVSAAALAIAQENGQRLQATVNWIQADILDPTAWPSLSDLWAVVSNPPYIPPSEHPRMDEGVRLHEPSLALFVPEEDPLLFYRVIAAYAKTALRQRGYLFFELNDAYAHQVAALVAVEGFVEVEILRDMQGFERMLRARMP
jgi:release factor glutamine methyltransferase